MFQYLAVNSEACAGLISGDIGAYMVTNPLRTIIHLTTRRARIYREIIATAGQHRYRRSTSAPQIETAVIALTINGAPCSFESPLTVAQLIEQLDLIGKRVALERNGEIVPRGQFDQAGAAPVDRAKTLSTSPVSRQNTIELVPNKTNS